MVNRLRCWASSIKCFIWSITAVITHCLARLYQHRHKQAARRPQLLLLHRLYSSRRRAGERNIPSKADGIGHDCARYCLIIRNFRATAGLCAKWSQPRTPRLYGSNQVINAYWANHVCKRKSKFHSLSNNEDTRLNLIVVNTILGQYHTCSFNWSYDTIVPIDINAQRAPQSNNT